MEILKAETPPLSSTNYCAMDSIDHAILEEWGDVSTKAPLLLLNSKNNNTKKDLYLSYTKGKKSAYLTTAKAMARYLSTQYPNKTIGHQSDKKGDKNRKKVDDSKPENKDNNITGTAGAHIGEVTTPEDSTAPSDVSSIDAHVLEVAKHNCLLALLVEDLLEAHIINDATWGHIHPSDVSIDTVDSA